MAKLRTDPIKAGDVWEFIENHSDFAFELSVYDQLTKLGFTCDHGGTYTDPLTEEIRQFDIRATWTDQDQGLLPHEQIRLAVECKQLRDNFPLVIHTVPRKFDEGTHDILLSVTPEEFSLPAEEEIAVPAFVPSAMKWNVSGRFSIYNENQAVGKSCAQVGRDHSGIISTNSEVFSKWTQAISSAQAFADQACDEEARQSYRGALTILILLVVVIPRDRLWVVHFKADGTPDREPRQVSRCSYWIDSTFECGDRLTGFPFTLSHLEFTTTDGLTELIRDLLDRLNRDRYFARQDLKRLLGLELGASPVDRR